MGAGAEAGAVSVFSALGVPGTRRRRSSSCVLSFGDICPTIDQIFSPTSTYPSLYNTSELKEIWQKTIYNTDLSTRSADFRTVGSLSEIMLAITGKAFAGSQAPIPNRFSKLACSSKVP